MTSVNCSPRFRVSTFTVTILGKPTDTQQDSHAGVLNAAIPPGDTLPIPYLRDMASSKKLDAMSPHTRLFETATDVAPGSDDSSLEHPLDVDAESLRRPDG